MHERALSTCGPVITATATCPRLANHYFTRTDNHHGVSEHRQKEAGKPEASMYGPFLRHCVNTIAAGPHSPVVQHGGLVRDVESSSNYALDRSGWRSAFLPCPIPNKRNALHPSHSLLYSKFPVLLQRRRRYGQSTHFLQHTGAKAHERQDPRVPPARRG